MSDVWSAGVVLARVEEEPKAVDELNPLERANAQVEEDPEDDGHGNLPQHLGQEDGQAHHEVDHEAGHSLVCSRKKQD